MTPSTKLFNKTELFFRGLELRGVNLGQVAKVVAEVLGLEPSKVMVVDARDDLITLDLLQQDVDLSRIVSQENKLLASLSRVSGIQLTQDSRIHSEGVLGLISLPQSQADGLPERVEEINREITARVAQRALVYPTGDEIVSGRIVDTNTPFLVELLESQGYRADSGPPLPDDQDWVVGKLSQAAMNGYGLVVTTGGTGAEQKDCVVEAIQSLDPDAATPYTAHYRQGQGRHHKDGVRLAVGRMDLTTYIALTGPHQEVVQVAPTLIRGLREGWEKRRLAEEMAARLRRNY